MLNHQAESPFAVELINVTKRFGNTIANHQINLKIKRGSIHGIVGENGAGKSTAMNMLYGFYTPDEGSIKIDNKDVFINSPAKALSLGIGMLHQHFLLSSEESALDNILIGAEPVRPTFKIPKPFRWIRQFFKIDRSQALSTIENLLDSNSSHINLKDPVEKMSVGQQQRIEVLKVLYRSAEIIILDEPTAVLTPQETLQLFDQLRKLKGEGKTILIITHKLREVLNICDEVTVFRQGKVVASRDSRKTTESELAELMVGRVVDLHSRKIHPLKVSAQSVLIVENLSLQIAKVSKLKNLNLEIAEGEILGIAGVQGNGQTELQNFLLNPSPFFQKKMATGNYKILGQDVGHLPTRELFKSGLASLADDRLRHGAIASLSIEENFYLGLQNFPHFKNGIFSDKKNIRSALKKAKESFDIKYSQENSLFSSMSGGNQQKLVIARELAKNPKVLIAAQPTRGVDIGAIEFIHQKLREYSANGMSVILISSELSELFALSHRILVMYNGQLGASFNPERSSESDIGLAMGGAT